MDDIAYYKLEKQPLLFVLAEFRFPDVLKIDKFVPDVQECLREQLPYFEEQQSQKLTLQPDGINITAVPRYVFTNKLQQQAVVLESNRLFCVSSVYNRFDGFKSFCSKTLRIIEDIIHPSALQRLGLRFADLVMDDTTGADITSYVNFDISYHAHLESIGTLVRKASEFVFQTTEGHMTIRTLYGSHNLSVLPDVGQLPIKLPEVASFASKRIILDFDHVWESMTRDEDINFSAPHIVDKLNGLHALSRECFWNIVTKEGLQSWK
ncbi:TIGR04255 family protein [Pelistega europaea]|uniref:TIGR04255 family protein n=1 Tax=Pelistega europaea TaxID=106147 RepID=A0A7Y4P331_9BURK|nr:TIGR04255 family protein [Pelistega europaea]NOL48597.1 TIGR04255 family protein [Pelistega europaea]